MVTRDELGHGLAPEFRQRRQALGTAGLAVTQNIDVGRQTLAFVTYGLEKVIEILPQSLAARIRVTKLRAVFYSLLLNCIWFNGQRTC